MALPRIVDLEVEVLASILEYVDDESPRTTAAVAQVCKHFNFALKLVRYRRLTVQWDQGKHSWVNLKGEPQHEWETPDLLRGLRHLTVCRGNLPTVTNDGGDEEHDNEETLDSTTIDTTCFAGLESTLCNASNLKILIWKVGYFPPHEITETLQAHHPKAKMNVHRAKRLNDVVGLLRSEKALAASPCLNTLSITASYGTCIEDHMVFQVILALASNLKFASMLSQPPMRPGDTELSNRWRADPKLWFPKEQKNYIPNASLRHLTLDGWCLSAETLDYWSRYVNLASLESLKCSRGSIYPSYFQRAPQLLTHLKHVSLNLNPQECDEPTAEAIARYIATCPPLLTLSLWSWRGRVPLSSILSQHGPTLIELHLHEREQTGTHAWSDPREPLSLEELQSVREACPNLRALTFDLDRCSRHLEIEDYEETLKELRKFKLEKLEIYLDCGLAWLWSLYLTPELTRKHYGAREDDSGRPDDVGLPGHCDGDSEFNDAIPVPSNPEEFGMTGSDSVIFQPPSTNKDICRFLIKAWQSIFGCHTTGSRQLSLKFGEWERKVRPVLPGRHGGPQRDVRVWCRARPHERDDENGQCAVEIDCCGGEHKRKFTSGQAHFEPASSTQDD